MQGLKNRIPWIRLEYLRTCLWYPQVVEQADLAFAGNAPGAFFSAADTFAKVSFAAKNAPGAFPPLADSSGEMSFAAKNAPGAFLGGKSEEEVAAAFDRYGDSCLRLAYSYLHNRADAEDILQEALIRYMQKAPAFESSEHEKAWLLRVTANLAKNRIDYKKAREADELSEELVAEEREDLSFVWEAVKSLPDNQRSVVHLFYQEGYATAEIAAVLDMKEATVRSHLKRGRDRLKSILKEEYDFG